MTTVTLLHPGSMGAAVGAQATAAGHRVHWVPDGRGNASHARAEQAGLIPAESLDEALAASDLVLSICPPHAAEQVASAVAASDYRGIYIDANAISPQRMLRIEANMARECTVVDGAIIGPPPTDDRSARLYLAGNEGTLGLLAKVFAGSSVHVREVGPDLGAASALKMAFASYQKPARALAGVAHALATSHGVADLLTAEAQTMSSQILSDPDYLPSVAARAWRWAPEMLEVEETLQAASLPTDFAQAAAAVMEHWEQNKDITLPLATILSQLHDAEPEQASHAASQDLA
ncbi:NAD(P)-dependent oxidoreductase [Streptomyces sp. NRRL B-1347]|uniref:NAD(P)-dependent oxidoreductase n=1 Tax=Streptomyces sp. NRRL B-1347 TaxID=1476877 RepID=UPI00068C92CE|nr:NAD(P)-dependent oxidoreductase [Streptomyces sp. NRRL B-1347]